MSARVIICCMRDVRAFHESHAPLHAAGESSVLIGNNHLEVVIYLFISRT